MFTFNHLDDVKESYFKHFKDAMNISCSLFIGSIQVFIHAFYPDIFTSSASNRCRDIIKLVDNKNK